MFKFGTIGSFKQVRNNPNCKATKNVQLGMVVALDEVTGSAPTPATAVIAQSKNIWVVNNIIDQPEVYNSKTYEVVSGDYVRAMYMPDLVELPVELDYRVVKGGVDTLAKGDILVPSNDVTDTTDSGKWVKADGTIIKASDYKINLIVLEKTTFGDKGVTCKVALN